jgi:hypothetical protein
MVMASMELPGVVSFFWLTASVLNAWLILVMSPFPEEIWLARQPWRMAIAHLLTITEARPDLLASLVGVEERKVEIVLQAIKRGSILPLRQVAADSLMLWLASLI